MRFFFGAFVLDTETRQLLRSDEALHLTPKAFELLQGLLRHRPRVLGKAELRQLLWPGTHVLEANLPNLVAEVRTAIVDDARNPRFIRTVHGRGYAFCGEAAERGPSMDRGTEVPFVYRLTWQGGLVALAEGDYVLGRHAACAVPIEAGNISRRHARLRISDGQAMLEDLGSRNGTFVSGDRIEGPARLADGDAFRLGSVSFTFRATRTVSFPETRDD